MNKPRTLDYTIYVNLQRDWNLAGDWTDIDCHQTVPVHLTQKEWDEIQSLKWIMKGERLRQKALEVIQIKTKQDVEELLHETECDH